MNNRSSDSQVMHTLIRKIEVNEAGQLNVNFYLEIPTFSLVRLRWSKPWPLQRTPTFKRGNIPQLES